MPKGPRYGRKKTERVEGIALKVWHGLGLSRGQMQGLPSVVCGCFGGSNTRTLNRKFPIVQSLLQSRLPLSGISVLWWLKNPYFASAICNGSKSHTFRVCPEWYVDALVAQKPGL